MSLALRLSLMVDKIDWKRLPSLNNPQKECDNDSATSDPDMRCYLLRDLPYEIRCTIWKLVIGQPMLHIVQFCGHLAHIPIEYHAKPPIPIPRRLEPGFPPVFDEKRNREATGVYLGQRVVHEILVGYGTVHNRETQNTFISENFEERFDKMAYDMSRYESFTEDCQRTISINDESCIIHPPLGNVGMLLHVCRQMYTETIELLYNQPTFIFTDSKVAHKFVRSIPEHCRTSIQSLAFLTQPQERAHVDASRNVALLENFPHLRNLHVSIVLKHNESADWLGMVRQPGGAELVDITDVHVPKVRYLFIIPMKAQSRTALILSDARIVRTTHGDRDRIMIRRVSEGKIR